jgi:hypothetical protein
MADNGERKPKKLGAGSRGSQNEDGVAATGVLAGGTACPTEKMKTRVAWDGKRRRALRRPGLADLSPGVSPDESGPCYGRPPMIETASSGLAALDGAGLPNSMPDSLKPYSKRAKCRNVSGL